jgi:hypothetical protein
MKKAILTVVAAAIATLLAGSPAMASSCSSGLAKCSQSTRFTSGSCQASYNACMRSGKGNNCTFVSPAGERYPGISCS